MPKNSKVLEEVGDVPLTEENIGDLGVGSANYMGFEHPENLDPKYAYRWVNIDSIPLMRTKKYVAVEQVECKRIMPLFGEWKDGAWHLFEGSKSHMIFMRCPKAYFNARRTYYGNQARENIEIDKESLKEIGHQAWKKGDSIGPDDVIVDKRPT